MWHVRVKKGSYPSARFKPIAIWRKEPRTVNFKKDRTEWGNMYEAILWAKESRRDKDVVAVQLCKEDSKGKVIDKWEWRKK